MQAAVPPEPPRASPSRGNPGTVGIPTVIAGATALGLVLIGYASAAGPAIPIIMTATCAGLLIATVWAAALGQNVLASVYAVFLGFYLSYVALQVGLLHGWYGTGPGLAAQALVVYLVCWLVTIAVLTIATLRLPLAFTVLLLLVDLALALLLIGVLAASVADRAGAIVVFAFIAVGIYLYFDVMLAETGKHGLPLGRPLLGA